MRRVLTFSCLHAPFVRKGYLEFLKKEYKKWKCNEVVILGDEMEYHRLSVHPKAPEAMGALEEHNAGIKVLKRFYKAFPKAKCCTSNHTSRPFRVAAQIGLPEVFVKEYRDFLKAPKGWSWKDSWLIDGVTYKHGEGNFGGAHPHRNAAIKHRGSIVIGHWHASGGVIYLASDNDLIFGMCVGCGLEYKGYAFRYAKNMTSKPIVGCGVVIGGKEAYFIPMDLGTKRK